MLKPGARKRSGMMLYAAAYAGGATLQKGVGFLLFMWLAHSLTVEQYARFGLFYALQTGVAAFAVAGIIEAVVGLLREHGEGAARRQLYASANTVFAGLALLAMGGALGAFLWLSASIGASGWDIAWVTLAGLASAFFTLQSLLARLEEQHQSSLWLSFIPPLASLLAGFAVFLWRPAVSSFYAGMAGGMVCMLVGYRLFGARFAGFGAAGTPLRQIGAGLGPFMLIVALAWLGGYGNTYLVQSMFSASDVARFTFAYTLSSVLQLVATSLNQVWAPRFYREVHELPPAQMEQRNSRFYSAMGLFLGLVGAAVLVALPLALSVAGPTLAPYANMDLELALLFAAYAVAIPWWHVQNYYLVHGKAKELMYVVLATSVLGLAGWLALMWLMGPLGVYAGFALMMLVRSLGAYLWARRTWPLRPMWQGSVIALALLGLGAVGALQLR